MGTSADDRCDYRLEIGLEDDDIPSGECGRPVWEDYDYCIWHAKEGGKTREMIEDEDPDPGDHIEGAHLRDASLVDVDWFEDTSLVGADFSNAEINATDFSEANLTLANLSGASAIEADFTDACLEGAIFTNSDLRRATLEGALLNEAVFTNVHIDRATDFGAASPYESEDVEPQLGGHHRLDAAAWAYRQLQQIYSENSLPSLAQRSYINEKDARRRLAWDQNNYSEAMKWELSRWVMYYGSSPYRILGVALLVITACALLYPITGGIQEVAGEETITYRIVNPEVAPHWWIAEVLFRSFYFSVITFATLGYGDIQPIGEWARLLAGVETILGSLLSALLVFVLARVVTW